MMILSLVGLAVIFTVLGYAVLVDYIESRAEKRKRW